MAQRIRADVFRTVDAPDPAQLPQPKPAAPEKSGFTTETISTTLLVDEYPTVKPDRAKQYLSAPEGFGPWRIFVRCTNCAVTPHSLTPPWLRYPQPQ